LPRGRRGGHGEARVGYRIFCHAAAAETRNPLKASKRANIVMVSSGLGSFGWLSDPANANYGFNLFGHSTSKNALNGVMLVFSSFDFVLDTPDQRQATEATDASPIQLSRAIQGR
jgi:hypothetical protein